MQPQLRQMPPSSLALDDRGLQPKLRRADRRDIAAGPGAQHDEVVILSHSSSSFAAIGRGLLSRPAQRTQDPHVCRYNEQQRSPADQSNRAFASPSGCADPSSPPRGEQQAPQGSDATVVASYDPSTGDVAPASRNPDEGTSLNGGEHVVFGDDSWKWLLLGPLGRSDR